MVTGGEAGGGQRKSDPAAHHYVQLLIYRGAVCSIHVRVSVGFCTR